MKRSCYKVINWKQCNQALKQRGSLQVWVADEVERQWYFKGESQWVLSIVKIKCYALNKMAKLGMPDTIKVKTAA